MNRSSFADIARELGISRRAAENAYSRALRKIRRRPRQLARFRELVEFRAQLKNTGRTL